MKTVNRICTAVFCVAFLVTLALVVSAAVLMGVDIGFIDGRPEWPIDLLAKLLGAFIISSAVALAAGVGYEITDYA